MKGLDSESVLQDQDHAGEEYDGQIRELSVWESTKRKEDRQRRRAAQHIALLRRQGVLPAATSELGFLNRTTEIEVDMVRFTSEMLVDVVDIQNIDITFC